MFRRLLVLLALFAVVAAAHPVFAQSYEVVAKFSSEPREPGGLMTASNGDLYGVTASGGFFGLGTVYRMTNAGTPTIVHSFTGGTGGQHPSFALVETADHHLYGATPGETNEDGTIFRVNPNGTVETVHSVFEWRPLTKMVEANGILYGAFAVRNGVETDTGVFSFDPAAGEFQTIHTFDPLAEGGGPSSLLLASDGFLYGTLEGHPAGMGAAFRMDTSGDTLILHVFPAHLEGSPKSLLQSSDNFFYGVSIDPFGVDGTAIFRMDFNGNVVTLAALGTDVEFTCCGSLPGLVEAGGFFYGTTSFGGDFGRGMVYRVSPAGTLTILGSFDAPFNPGMKTALALGTDGKFYGTAGHSGNGAMVFRVSTAGVIQQVHDFLSLSGASPLAPLIRANDGLLYGTTDFGGEFGRGVVYKFTPGVGHTVLHSFTPSEGNRPMAALFQANDDRLYGVTQTGGEFDLGTIFRIRLDGTGFATLHSFDEDGARGLFPEASLVQASDGWLYGTARDGGEFGWGTVFRISTSGVFELVHSFEGAPVDGAFPTSPLLVADDGFLYGSTQMGGDYDLGILFKMDLAGNLTKLHTFQIDENTGMGGFFPNGLIQARDGLLYGTTKEGNALDENGGSAGTIFRISLAGAFEHLADFNGTNGSAPVSNLFQADDDLIYGITSTSGGFNGWYGTLVRLGQGGITTVKIFGENNDDTGFYPNGPLVRAPNGLFYGTTSGGGAGAGVIFSINLISETPVGTAIEVQPVDANTGTAPVNLTFNEIVDAGSTTVTVTTTAPVPPPAGFNLGGTPTYFDIETTATFAGDIQVCFNYSGLSLVDPATAQLKHWNGTEWENVTTSNNVETQIICGSVSSLSPFIIGNEVDTAYTVNPMFDQNRVYKIGSTVPIRIQILDNGTNVSASTLSVVATGIRRKTVETNWGVPEDPGNSNPDLNFRYALTDEQPGYQFNLKTKGYSKGTYELQFVVGPAHEEFVIEFQVR